MICTLNQLEVFGIKDGTLSDKYDTFLGAFAYCLACGCISRDPCWAEAFGAKQAVINTIKFLKIKYDDKDIASEFDDVISLFGYRISTYEEGVYQFSASTVRVIERADPEFLSHYSDNLVFKEFVDIIRNCSIIYRGGFSDGCYNLVKHIKKTKFLESFKTIINNFISERNMYVAKDDRIDHKLFEMCAQCEK